MRQNLRQALQLFGVSTQVDRRALVDLIDVTELEVLNGLGLIVPTTRRSSVACESCDDGHLLPVQRDDDEAFIACSKSATRQLIDHNDYLGYSLNIRRFLELFLDAEGIEPSLANIKQDGIFWDVGSAEIAGAAQSLFFIDGLHELNEENQRTMMKRNNPCLLFLADPSGESTSHNVHAVPILSLIYDIDEGGIQLDAAAEETHLHRDYAFDNEDSVWLDEHIVLMLKNRELLFLKKGLGQFEGVLPLYQPAVRMIEYLHNARTKDEPTVSLATLAEKFASGNKRTISTYKKQINDAALKYGTKTVLDKDGRSRYRLNPRLDCCT